MFIVESIYGPHYEALVSNEGLGENHRYILVREGEDEEITTLEAYAWLKKNDLLELTL